MSSSLRDQLLKAGLVSEKQAKNAAHEQRKTRRGPPGAQPAAQAAAQQAQAEKAARDRELNRKRQEEAERKALAAQIRQIIETNRLPKQDGDAPYSFVDGNKIRRLFVTKDMHAQLVSGKVCITRLGSRYELVPAAVAETIRERDPTRVILPGTPATEGADENDPYAAYQVPDDLMW